MALMTSCRWSPSYWSRAVKGPSACRSLPGEAFFSASCFKSCRTAHTSGQYYNVPVPWQVRWRQVDKPATVLKCGATSDRTIAQQKPSEVARKLVNVKLEEANLSDEAQINAIGSEAAPGYLNRSANQETLKTCLVCQQSKLLEDYQNTSSSLDGRTDTCRACIAAFIARRLGREMGHLALSVEESWQSARKCSSCGQTKEVRDFQKDRSQSCGLNRACRACMSKRAAKSPDKVPIDTPLLCTRCDKVKAASNFAKERRMKTGRLNICRECQRAARKERHLSLKRAPEYLPRLKKFCTSCKEEKPTIEFYHSVACIDGFFPVCKKCAYQAKERRRRNRMK